MSKFKEVYEAKSEERPKAKVGDIIQSFDVAQPIMKTRGSLIGKVKKLEVDKTDGVTYVHFDVICEMFDGVIKKPRTKKARAPQNGTPTSLGGFTDGIVVMK